MKKLLVGILAVALFLSLGIVASAQFSTIDGFGSQFVTGDATVEVKAMMYDVRDSELTVYIKVTNNTGGALTFDNNELRLYHGAVEVATDDTWNTGAIAGGAFEELQEIISIVGLQVEFALAADVSITP